MVLELYSSFGFRDYHDPCAILHAQRLLIQTYPSHWTSIPTLSYYSYEEAVALKTLTEYREASGTYS
ncbi:hypothetical protein ABKN59_007836 [Abortiporus biennis]